MPFKLVLMLAKLIVATVILLLEMRYMLQSGFVLFLGDLACFSSAYFVYVFSLNCLLIPFNKL
jgi:hypothetical protein